MIVQSFAPDLREVVSGWLVGLVVDVSLLSSEHRTLAYSNPDLAGCQTAYVQVLMVVTHEET